MLLQKWGILLLEEDRKKMEAIKRQMRVWVRGFVTEIGHQEVVEIFM